jgi:hypothetical protein
MIVACAVPTLLNPQSAVRKLAEISNAHPQLSAAAQQRWAAREMGVDADTFRNALNGGTVTPEMNSAEPQERDMRNISRRSFAAASLASALWMPADVRAMFANVAGIDVPPEVAARMSKDPTTVRGYIKMFDAVNTDEWGGGDVSISYQMPDGRRVWLYGDTLSAKNGFVHSTALIQKNGVLTPANGGRQILPNGGADPSDPSREIIYWIDGVKQGKTADQLLITAMEMSIGKAGPWDFRETSEGSSRQATVRVTAGGNMQFVKWNGYVPAPVKGNPHKANDFQDLGGGHVTYGTVTHDIKLANGKYLTTRSQNYTDPYDNHVGPNGFRWHDYRPTFSSTTRRP